MAYTAIKEMQKKNQRRFGNEAGPEQPFLSDGAQDGFDLKSAALRFIHERCENLRFDIRLAAEEEKTGVYFGTSLAPGQIPYNMQMDINRLCLERELERFMDSGATEDAYNVYYCFLEIFFGSYGKSKRMVELLSEYESNSSSLLMDHRDHYSHSVYVFILGLAIYETNSKFRHAFNAFYHFDRGGDTSQVQNDAANFFLEFWGLTSLFHDIGYPFELVFEQVMSYFEVNDDDRGKNNPYIIYKNTESLSRLGDGAKERFLQLYGKHFDSIEEVLAFDITQKLGPIYDFSEAYLLDVLKKKPVSPESFCFYMDHAYFSTLRLYHELTESMGIDSGEKEMSDPKAFTFAHVDALSAILLHYDLYTYSIASKDKPKLSMHHHPLAWLLMLCDELQCWDRTAYGRNSRNKLYPMAVEFDFSDDRILARYVYDEEEQDKIDRYLWSYVEWKKGGKICDAPKLKAYSDMADDNKSFIRSIEEIVDITDTPLTVVCDTAPVNRGSKHAYLSNSSFMHMHDFAIALNARNYFGEDEEQADKKILNDRFNSLSLEYKLFYIHQVSNFSRYLNAIHCFYTDRPVDFDMLSKFTEDQIDILSPMEHERWVKEHQVMGWKQGDLYERVSVPEGVDETSYRIMLREQLRCHRLATDGQQTREQILSRYQDLSKADKDKNRQVFNSMLKLLKTFDGLRIYQY